MKRSLLVALLSLLAVPAFAAELEGVTSADTMTVEGKTLNLNGMGLRRKFVFNVYVASLYVENKSTSGPDILKADAVRRVEMKMLRDLDQKTIVEAIRTGFEKNAGKSMEGLKERLDKFVEKIPDLKKGQSLVVQYVPGKGTTVEGVSGSYVADGKDFADALFSVWIGQSPVDDNLKKGMLGGK
ncbi:MAG: chalcone isomerase family protein [Myxococcaceae bacterium]